MKKLLTVSRLATVLFAGSALVIAGPAYAKGDHKNFGNSQGNGHVPQFAIQGQSVSVKHFLHNKKSDGDKYAKKDHKKKGCKNVTVPTADCGPGTHDPVGNTNPGGKTGGGSTTGGNTTAKGPSPAYTTVTLSNGVINTAIFNGKGIMVTSNSPGTITVSNGNTSVTLPGGSISLHGALSVSAAAGMQIVHLRNGDIGVAASPVLINTPPKPISSPVPPGVTFGDDLKAVGKTAGNIAAGGLVGGAVVPASAGMIGVGGVVATIAGHPIKGTKEIAKDIIDDAGKLIEWASGWF